MIRALAAAAGFVYVAHSPTLTAAILPTAVTIVAAELLWVVRTARRLKVKTP